MTRKYFKAIAEALHMVKPTCAMRLAQWESDVREIAGVCSQFNGNFDHDRFYQACGYKG